MSGQFDEAKAYVESMRAQGRTDVEITNVLKAAGWGEEQINQLFRRPEPVVSEDTAVSPTLVEQPPRTITLVRRTSVQAPTPATKEERPRTVSFGYWPDEQERLRSPNKEWSLYCTTDEAVKRHVLVLIKGSQIQWQFPLSQTSQGSPGACALTDTGYVVITKDSYVTATQSVTTNLLAISPTGEQLLNKRLSVGTDACGISSDAAFVWCKTLNSDKEAYAKRLFVFTLNPPKLLFNVKVPYGGIEEVSQAGDEVVVITDAGLDYHYSLKGELLNEQEIGQREGQARLVTALEKRDGYAIMQIVELRVKETALDKMTQDELSLLQQLTERASECEISAYTKAQVYRYLGEIALACGAKRQAIQSFKRALELNPKVGVKKQLAALEKDLQSETS